jgi:ADP-heptose:LPS heptosyltransferase
MTDSPAHLAGVLANCRLIIGVDTGPLHVAAMIGKPCLGIYYGSMHFRETGPYGDGHVVITPDDPDYPCHEREMDQSPEKYADLIPAHVVIETAGAMLTDEAIPDFNGFRIFRSRTGNGVLEWDEINDRYLHSDILEGGLKP